MNHLIPLLLAAVILSTRTVVAQETKPEALPEKPMTTGSNGESPSSLSEQIPLIPESVPSVTKPSSTGGEQAGPEGRRNAGRARSGITLDEMKERIRFREVRTLALKDAGVQDAWNRAQVAKTDPEKRAILKQFYTRLFDRMARIDGSLKKQIEEKKAQAVNAFDFSIGGTVEATEQEPPQ